ncbi:4-hydroxy-tetrahydrodipicolinate reductase [Arenimonas oryziterrae]|uniref:4-hydroxy-tetrahydrodipicolinate reductase n=1 Tax=Arenimonas oryziterrae DSM 21050 = YC6267 TaxID=1121015 RepID=A0A091BJL1_9GAMM|nr:4-hydroxy-tetrahydrodipicolinate reductase [Arenimonas oryziterrae]KFN44515.1 hypothetical protein N789_00480 [Arenimonas oryziterrae DSM 21050 = YC6267]
MTDPLRVLIHGASGRMGLALLRLARENPALSVVAAVSHSGRAIDGVAVPVFASADLARCPAFDIAIDFSLPEGFDSLLAACVVRGAALVSGTTGLSDGQRETLDAAGQVIPVLWASNFSLGVVVLEELSRRAARALSGWDADVIEAHHIHKKDAPSGTALTLGAAVADGRGSPPHYASLRAGDIVGEHTVQFSGPGERIELTHRATNRDIFARGALSAAAHLRGRAAGNYRLADLIFAS